eukprot:Amastigsp_a340100_34.p5 type:complete len:104 gc:universal Amastigsp_a340100_34:1743-2054(+)
MSKNWAYSDSKNRWVLVESEPEPEPPQMKYMRLRTCVTSKCVAPMMRNSTMTSLVCSERNGRSVLVSSVALSRWVHRTRETDEISETTCERCPAPESVISSHD